MLAAAGCIVTDADALVEQLYRPGEPGARAVADIFGAEMLRPDGSVDKEALGARVFADPESRARLERAIHPLVGQRWREVVEAAAAAAIVVFEVPLLAEGGGRGRYDAVVTVEASKARRLERAVERGLARDQASARMAAQATSGQRRALADFVIENDGDLPALQAQVTDILGRLRTMARDRRS